MKKNLSILFLLLLLPSIAFAQEEAPKPLQIDQKIDVGIEEFLEKILNMKYESAYHMMTEDFMADTQLTDFILILKEAGLTDFTSKTWTGLKRETYGIIATLQGDFLSPDGNTHSVTFDIFVDAHDINIRNITETISLEDLKTRFPDEETLEKTVETDVRAITDLLYREQVRNLFFYLKSNPKNMVKWVDIVRMIITLRESDLSVKIPENAVLHIRKNPTVTKDGYMHTMGYFLSSTSRVYFIIDYDYQWKWKLIGFSLNLQPFLR